MMQMCKMSYLTDIALKWELRRRMSHFIKCMLPRLLHSHVLRERLNRRGERCRVCNLGNEKGSLVDPSFLSLLPFFHILVLPTRGREELRWRALRKMRHPCLRAVIFKRCQLNMTFNTAAHHKLLCYSPIIGVFYDLRCKSAHYFFLILHSHF